MSRFLPRSLFGQTLLILLAGLIVSHAVGSWIYTADREQAVRAVGGFAAAQRIANLTRLVQDAPREWRQRIVTASSDQMFRVSISAKPAAGVGTGETPVAEAIRSFLVDQLALAADRQPVVSVSLVESDTFDHPHFMMGRGPKMGGGPMMMACRLPQSCGRRPAGRRRLVEFRDGLARGGRGAVAPAAHLDGVDGHHHSRRLDLGGAPRDRAVVVAGRSGRAARRRSERAAGAGNRLDRDAARLARLQHHAGAAARPDRKPHPHARRHLARPAHAADAASPARRERREPAGARADAGDHRRDGRHGRRHAAIRPRRGRDGSPQVHRSHGSGPERGRRHGRCRPAGDNETGGADGVRLPARCAPARAAQPARQRDQIRKDRARVRPRHTGRDRDRGR